MMMLTLITMMITTMKMMEKEDHILFFMHQFRKLIYRTNDKEFDLVS